MPFSSDDPITKNPSSTALLHCLLAKNIKNSSQRSVSSKTFWSPQISYSGFGVRGSQGCFTWAYKLFHPDGTHVILYSDRNPKLLGKNIRRLASEKGIMWPMCNSIRGFQVRFFIPVALCHTKRIEVISDSIARQFHFLLNCITPVMHDKIWYFWRIMFQTDGVLELNKIERNEAWTHVWITCLDKVMKQGSQKEIYELTATKCFTGFTFVSHSAAEFVGPKHDAGDTLILVYHLVCVSLSYR